MFILMIYITYLGMFMCVCSVFVQYNNLTHIKITSRLRYLQLLIFHADNSLYSEYGEIYCGAPSQQNQEKEKKKVKETERESNVNLVMSAVIPAAVLE